MARLARENPQAMEALRGAFAAAGIALDPERGRIEFEAALNAPEMPLEYLLASPRGATHECILVTTVSPTLLTAAIYVLGLQPGKNVDYRERVPPPTEEEARRGAPFFDTIRPTGDGFYLYVEWREGEELRHYRVEDLVVNARSGRSIPRERWVFLGSRFVRPAKGDAEVFAAEAEGNLAAINFFSLGNQILTYPHEDASFQNVFYPNEALLPDPGTPVRVLLSRERLERPYGSSPR